MQSVHGSSPPSLWIDPGHASAWTWPLPNENSRVSRAIARILMALLRRRIARIDGIEHVLANSDPFIIAANHSCRRDALLLAATLFLSRGGDPVHFLADWNFKMIPGVSTLYSRTGVIVVGRKSAKPEFLNVFKPYLTDDKPPFQAARERLDAGRPIALFPEGTTNRRTNQLLRGRSGCARLALEAGVPVIPAGIAYPGYDQENKKPLSARAHMVFGAPISGGAGYDNAPLSAVRVHHESIMQAIAGLCGKSWPYMLSPTER